MSRFNEKTEDLTATTNFEGVKVFKLNSEMELYSLVVTSMFSNKYYKENSDEMDRLRLLISKCTPSYVCQLAIYAREEMYLRTIPIVLVLELNKYLKENDIQYGLIDKTITRIIQRADEITEVLGYYQKINKDNEQINEILVTDFKNIKKLCKLSHAVSRGVAGAFNKFDRYSLQKYNRKKEITLKDALFLTHPKPKNNEQQKIFNELVSDSLPTPKTWEVMLSNSTKSGKTKKQIWEEIIDMWIVTK